MSDIKRLLIITMFLFIAMTIICVVSAAMGYNKLAIENQDLVLSPLGFYIIQSVVFAIQIFIMCSVVLNKYNVGIIKFVIPLVLIKHVAEQIISQQFVAFVLPIVYLITVIIAFYKDKNLRVKSFKRMVWFSVSVAIYQLSVLFYKLGHITTLTTYEWVISSIDLIIFMVLLYLIGGEKDVPRISDKSVCSPVFPNYGRFNFLFPQNFNVVRCDNEDSLALEQFAALTGRKRLKAMLLLLGFNLFQWVIVLIVCNFDNVFIEGLIVTTSYICFGFIIRRRWHSKNLLVCTSIATVLFYGCAKFSAFKYTQFTPILLGLLITYMMYRISLIVDKKTEKAILEEEEKIIAKQNIINEQWQNIDDISAYY